MKWLLRATAPAESQEVICLRKHTFGMPWWSWWCRHPSWASKRSLGLGFSYEARMTTMKLFQTLRSSDDRLISSSENRISTNLSTTESNSYRACIRWMPDFENLDSGQPCGCSGGRLCVAANTLGCFARRLGWCRMVKPKICRKMTTWFMDRLLWCWKQLLLIIRNSPMHFFIALLTYQKALWVGFLPGIPSQILLEIFFPEVPLKYIEKDFSWNYTNNSFLKICSDCSRYFFQIFLSEIHSR